MSEQITANKYKEISKELIALKKEFRLKSSSKKWVSKSKEAIYLMAEIKRLDSELKAIDKSIGDNSIPHGNYHCFIKSKKL